MGNEKSTAASKSDDAKTHSKGATARPQRMNVQRVQNVVLIWLDNSIDDKSTDYQNTVTQLRRAVNDMNTFTDSKECIQFIDNVTNNKACMIISSSLAQDIVPRIHNMSQVDSIFIFCDNMKYQEQWTQDWSKIKGIFTEILPICEALKEAAQQCEQAAISISFVTTGGNTSKQTLDHLDPIFIYTQILKEILLTFKFDDSHIKKFLDYCRLVFVDNDQALNNVTQLQTKYHTKTPIWWYTCESFLYPMLNYALRLMDMDIIIKMGFFISDLHRQIEQLHSEQFTSTNSKQVFIVCRGQGMSKTDFDKMTKTQGGLLSFNNFLLTSRDRQVSLDFAHRALPNMDMVGILFVMTIDPMKSTTPFASIVDVGFHGDQKDEILFSIRTIFRIGEITTIDKNQRLFQVQLTLTNDDDKGLRVLTDRIREETFPDDRGWDRLGALLLKMDESAKAQQVYEILLEQTTDVSEKARIFHQLGRIKDNQGQYHEAITFYEKVLEICQKILSPTDLNLASCYNNIGLVYSNMGDYSKAISYYEKDLEISKQSLPPNHPDLGASYNNIGLVYSKIGDYSKALASHEKALEISKQSPTSNSLDLAMSYSNIGLVYSIMGEYSKALLHYEKDLEIRKELLPSNHHSLGVSYNHIGLVYSKIGDYSKALSSHEKALKLQEQSLPSDHPDLGMSYNNIGFAYEKMGEYSKALSAHEKALEIRKKSLPPNSPSLGMSYNNLGLVYENMGDYPKARSFYEQAVDIGQHSLTANHPDLQLYKKNLEIVKKKM